MENLKIIGIIPARGGSKGVPRKNIRPLAGVPLIAYTIKEALKCKMLKDVVITTDDEEIREISIKYGAKVPFLRPKELAKDDSLVIPTIRHALLEMKKIEGKKYDYLVMLQPTTPLRSSQDIEVALKILIEKNADGIISVVDVDNWHPMKMKKFEGEKLVDYEKPPVENPPRQILPKVYMVNGAIYATKRDVFLEKNSFQGNFCLGYIMPPERSVNIDSELDFVLAEYLINKYGK